MQQLIETGYHNGRGQPYDFCHPSERDTVNYIGDSLGNFAAYFISAKDIPIDINRLFGLSMKGW